MKNLKEYLIENYLLIEGKMNDSLESTRPEETERHKKQYYDDSTPDSVFHTLGGRYVLEKDLSHKHDSYKPGEQLKLTSIQSLQDEKGVMRYHGITEHGHSIPMSHFKKPPIGKVGKNQQNLEEQQIKYLSSAIEAAKAKKGTSTIKIKTANGGLHDVAGIKAAGPEGGWPKADAYLHDIEETPVHWLSLKGDTFQQWGGYRGLEDHPSMKKVIYSFRELKNILSPTGKYLPPRSSFHHELNKEDDQDRDLILKSMYGTDHGKQYGINNVHAIYSGNTIGLKENSDGTHELAPNALYVNRNDHTSDMPKAKILVTNRAGLNQLGTGGRIMVTHGDNNKNSKPVHEVLEKFKEMKQKQKEQSVEKHEPMHSGKSFYGPSELK